MPDLHEIYEAIGGLRARVDHLAEQHQEFRLRGEKIVGKLDDLRATQLVAVQQHTQFAEKQEEITDRLKTAEATLKNHENIKRWGATIWAGSVMAASAVGYLIHHLQDWMRRFL